MSRSRLLIAFVAWATFAACACRSDRSDRTRRPWPSESAPPSREPRAPESPPIEPSTGEPSATGPRRPPPGPGAPRRPGFPGSQPGGEVVLSRIAGTDLCLTTGGVGALAAQRLMIGDAKMRAVARSSVGDAAELRFKYLGPTEQVARLASGSLRRQLGLKLRAADGCNLVYVMWRLEPKAELVVSVKLNPGKRTHRECGANGYRNVRARVSRPPPPLAPGEQHSLRADLVGDALSVRIDGETVWQGVLGQEVLGLAGPAGMRTDNVRLEAELLSQLAPPARRGLIGAVDCPDEID